jgi:hypothetical protein
MKKIGIEQAIDSLFALVSRLTVVSRFSEAAPSFFCSAVGQNMPTRGCDWWMRCQDVLSQSELAGEQASLRPRFSPPAPPYDNLLDSCQ